MYLETRRGAGLHRRHSSHDDIRNVINANIEQLIMRFTAINPLKKTCLFLAQIERGGEFAWRKRGQQNWGPRVVSSTNARPQNPQIIDIATTQLTSNKIQLHSLNK